MRRVGVRDSRIVYTQKFVFLDRTQTAVTREYLLPGDKIFFEQYVIWQADGVLDVVMLRVVEVAPERYAFKPIW